MAFLLLRYITFALVSPSVWPMRPEYKKLNATAESAHVAIDMIDQNRSTKDNSSIQQREMTLLALANKIESNPTTVKALGDIIDPFLVDMEKNVNESHDVDKKTIGFLEEAFTQCSQHWADQKSKAIIPDGLAHVQCRSKESELQKAHTACKTTLAALEGAEKTVSEDPRLKKAAQPASKADLQLPDPVAGENHSTYIDRLFAFLTTERETIAELETSSGTASKAVEDQAVECGADEAAWKDTQTDCNEKQSRHESATCSYTQSVESDCAMYTECYDAAFEHWVVQKSLLHQNEESRKNSFWMMERIKCFFEVFRTAGDDGHVDEMGVEIDKCKAASHEFTHLTLAWPDVVVPDDRRKCAVLPKPCFTAWTSAAYGSLPLDAPHALCTPCGEDKSSSSMAGIGDLLGTGEQGETHVLDADGYKLFGWCNFFGVSEDCHKSKFTTPTLWEETELPADDGLAKMLMSQRSPSFLTESGKVYFHGYPVNEFNHPPKDTEPSMHWTKEPTQVFPQFFANDPIEKAISSMHYWCFLTKSKKLWVAGRGWDGTLGSGQLPVSEGSDFMPVQPLGLPADDEVVDFDMFHGYGGTKVIVRTQSAALYTWGANCQAGSCGRSEGDGNNQPGRVELPEGEIALDVKAGGYAHLYVLTESRKLYAWGYNNFGQVTPDKQEQSRPVEITFPDGEVPKQLALSYGAVYVRTESGKIIAWGRNNWGQLGDGTKVDNTEKRVVLGLSAEPVVWVWAGSYHVFARAKSGKLYAWGRNDQYNLGLGHKDDVLSPTQVVGVNWPAI